MLRYTSPYIVRFYSSKNTLPFKVYLDLADVKTIYKENNRKSGIYRWVNLINGSTYIGSAADLTRRLRDYFSPAPQPSTPKLCFFFSLIPEGLLKWEKT